MQLPRAGNLDGMRDVLLVVDVLDDFGHEDGEKLLASFARRRESLVSLLTEARKRGVPVVYANDDKGIWDGNAQRIVDIALAGPGGHLVEAVAPRTGERFVVKPRYSAFDLTPLELILADLRCERLVLAGMTTEGCVAQTAIDARERGFKVSVVPDACATIDEAVEATALRYLVDVVGVRLEAPGCLSRGSKWEFAATTTSHERSAQ
jgi:nicotinamidase-related amidase